MHKGKYPFIQYSSTEVTTKNTHTYKNTQSHTHSQSYTYTNLHTHPKCKDENKLSLEFIGYERKTRIYSPSIKTEVLPEFPNHMNTRDLETLVVLLIFCWNSFC